MVKEKFSPHDFVKKIKQQKMSPVTFHFLVFSLSGFKVVFHCMTGKTLHTDILLAYHAISPPKALRVLITAFETMR